MEQILPQREPQVSRILDEHDVSDVTDALNFLLSALDCPRSVKVLVHAMVGFVAGRTDKVKFYHFDLGRRMYRTEYIENFDELAKARESIEGKVRKTMQKFIQWRDEWNLPIEYTPGTVLENGERVKSAVKMPLITWAVEVANRVRAGREPDDLSDRHRAKLYGKAVRDLLREKRVRTTKKDVNRTKREHSAEQIFRTYLTDGKRLFTKKMSESGAEPEQVISWMVNSLLSELMSENDGKGVKKTRLENDAEHPANLQNVDDPSAGILDTEPLSHISVQNSPYQEDESHGADEGAPVPAECLQALDAFVSVGADVEQALLIDDTMPKDDADRWTCKLDAGELAARLPWVVSKADEHGWSAVVRMSENVLQLDDVAADVVDVLRPYSFLNIETSPGNYQSWLAFKDEDDKAAVAGRLVEGLRQMFPGSGVNRGSGGATRWPGTRNYKPSRRAADGSWWTVRIHSMQAGRYVTPMELEDDGMLAHREPAAAGRGGVTHSMSGQWMPSYERCLQDAPLKADGSGPDESRADANFVTLCLLAGHQRQVTEAALRQVSTHAREHEPESYAVKTVQRVASYLELEKGRVYA